MNKTFKLSKYNFFINDNEENLIIYNFLTGINSITRVVRSDVDDFKKTFFTDKEISINSSTDYTKVIDSLVKSGILIESNIDENVLFDSKRYDQIYDSKLTLTILPTGNCNFKCPYCFEAHQHFCRDSMTINNQNALLKYVQRSIPNHKALHISWFGGEPLLSIDVIRRLSEKFLRICGTRHLPYSADIITNGFFLNDAVFDMLYKLKVYEYMITIDGFKEQHDKRRFTRNGKGSYDTIINNLLRIHQNKEYKFAKIMIRVNMSQGFLDKSDEFIEFLVSTFLDDPRFKVIFVPVVKFKGSEFPDKDIYSDHNKLFLHLHKNKLYESNIYSHEMKIASIVPQLRCSSSLKNSYVISPDLQVYKCNAHYDLDENKLGKINEAGELLIDDIRHKKWYLTSKFIKQVSENSNDCTNCFYSPCCYKVDSGCPISYLKSNQNDMPCPLNNEEERKNIIETILYVANTYPCSEIKF